MSMQIIDEEGFRANIGIMLMHDDGRLFWAKRVNQDAWQFPQGGMAEGETPVETLYRELYEEIGLKAEHVQIVAQTDDWLRYRLPKRLVREYDKPVCIGQKQKWFLLKLTAKSSAFDLRTSSTPEFDDWAWVNYWYPLRHVVAFKKDVYRQALCHFAQHCLSVSTRIGWDPFHT